MSRRGRPPKSLIAHVLDATFIPARHSALLAREELPAWAPRTLRDLQRLYRWTSSKRLQSAIACEFAEAARRGRAVRRLTSQPIRPRLTASQAILGQVGPIQIGDGSPAYELDEAWQAWDAEHGVRWRRLHGAALDSDQLVTPASDQAAASEDEWPPHPPGWEIVSSWGVRPAPHSNRRA